MHDSGTYALHRLLTGARDQAGNGVVTAWCTTLGTQPETDDFARKMSEVGALLDETLRAVDALADPRSREKYHRYTFGWWNAVYQPGIQWQAGATQESFMSQGHLDQLDSLAEYLAGQAERPADAPSPSDQDMQTLHADCTSWIAWLEGLDEVQLPRAQRHLLTEHFRQALWLIDNSNLFGPLHAAESVKVATDAVLLVAPARLSKKHVGEMVSHWAATSLLVGQLLTGPAAAMALLDQSLGAIKTGIEIFEQARTLELPPTDDSPAPVGPADLPRQLGAAPAGTTVSGE